MTRFKKLMSSSLGATAVEYGIIAALVAVVAAVGFTKVGNNLNTKIGTNVAGELDN